MKPTKLLIITHSAVLPTGLAETTRLIFNTLLQKYPGEYELHQVGLKHVHAVTQPTWPIYPTKAVTSSDGKVDLAKEDLHGQETVRSLLPKLEPDIVFAFNDPQNLEHLCVDARQRKHKLILYVTFDGFPVPPDFGCLFRADRVITMSEFAKNAFLASHQSRQAEKVDFIYAPADTARFLPVSEAEKMELRRELFPSWMPLDAFVLGWIGMNQWRKQVWVLYQVIHLLRTGQYLLCRDCGRTALIDSQASTSFPMSGAPWSFNMGSSCSCPRCRSANAKLAEPIEDIFLWLHMPRDTRLDTWPIDLIEKLYGVQPGRDIHYTEGHGSRAHLVPTDMPVVYQLWDGLLYLSGGEGFGIPAWEAMSTGLPVIYTNYSSHAEFLAKADGGLPIGGTLQPEPCSCTLRLIADAPQALEAIRKLYFEAQLRTKLGRNGRLFVERHSTEVQVERWHQTFRDCLAAK